MQASISSGCRNDSALRGEWDTHSSALGLQTQHFHSWKDRTFIHLFIHSYRFTEGLIGVDKTDLVISLLMPNFLSLELQRAPGDKGPTHLLRLTRFFQ
jgi:hypothetical protein